MLHSRRNRWTLELVGSSMRETTPLLLWRGRWCLYYNTVGVKDVVSLQLVGDQLWRRPGVSFIPTERGLKEAHSDSHSRKNVCANILETWGNKKAIQLQSSGALTPDFSKFDWCLSHWELNSQTSSAILTCTSVGKCKLIPVIKDINTFCLYLISAVCSPQTKDQTTESRHLVKLNSFLRPQIGFKDLNLEFITF